MEQLPLPEYPYGQSPVRHRIQPQNWRDTWGFNVSAEYKALDWLTLRGGYVFETSPMKDSTCDYMTPSNGRHRITAGVGFNWISGPLTLLTVT